MTNEILGGHTEPMTFKVPFSEDQIVLDRAHIAYFETPSPVHACGPRIICTN